MSFIGGDDFVTRKSTPVAVVTYKHRDGTVHEDSHENGYLHSAWTGLHRINTLANGFFQQKSYICFALTAIKHKVYFVLYKMNIGFVMNRLLEISKEIKGELAIAPKNLQKSQDYAVYGLKEYMTIDYK